MDMNVAQMNVYKEKHDGAWATNNHSMTCGYPSNSRNKQVHSV